LSSDTRGKLYGILPLLHCSDVDDLLRPDYGLSCQQIFTNLAIYLYQEHGPEILEEGSIIRNKGSIKSLPSWVPDWTYSKTERQMLVKCRGFQSMANFDIGEIPEPRCKFPINGLSVRQLQVRGARIGSLVQTSEECQVGENIFPLSQWRELAYSISGVTSRVDEPEADAFSMLITHDWIVYPRAVRDAIRCIVSWEEDKEDTVPLDSIMDGFAPSDKVQAETILNHCDDRRLAVLDTGYIALVPACSEITDVVYVLPGVSVPFVFRKQDDHFILLGECFVQAIVHGEAREDLDMSVLEDLVLE
jgi:hypothetical protein